MHSGGLVYTQFHQCWPLHHEPWDFLRFSKDAERGLLNEATGFEIVQAGDAQKGVSLCTENSSSPITQLDYQET